MVVTPSAPTAPFMASALPFLAAAPSLAISSCVFSAFTLNVAMPDQISGVANCTDAGVQRLTTESAKAAAIEAFPFTVGPQGSATASQGEEQSLFANIEVR